MKTLFNSKLKVYNGIVDLKKYADEWKSQLFNQIDVNQITTICDKYTKDLLTAERNIPDNKAIPVFKK